MAASRTTIGREFETAEQMLADARKAHEVGISTATIANRLYYACVHAAKATLYDRGFDPRATGVSRRCCRELVQTGDGAREFGRFLDDVETYRRRVDYGSGGVERETEEPLERTTESLAETREVTGRSRTDD